MSEDDHSPTMEEDIYTLERILSGEEKPRDLALPVLKKITENFSEERKIGKGGFGVVYKGVLKNWIVAVKRINVSEHTIDDKLFDREVKNLLGNIIHPNIVRFIGFCANTHFELIKEEGSAELVKAQIRERLLCFEYISNGSLDKHITDELRGLEWSIRFKIIKGICHGLHCLHEENNIVHMDLKPGNIMLDNDMVPKIMDFGLSRHDINTHTSGPRYVTRGYCAPEYETDSKTSKKADMYSLGVLIIELVTGCKNPPNNGNVHRRWRHRWNYSPKHTLLYQYQQVAKCMKIAAKCRNNEPADRPFILDIIRILSETESTNGHTDQINLYLDDDMLGIEPLKLLFPFEIEKPISSMIKLTNNTNDYYAFNIEMPSRQYHTQPNEGIVSPHSNRSIQLTMQSQKTQQWNIPYTDDFIVQSTKVNGDPRSEDITEQVFNKDQGKVDEVTFTVVVYDPNDPKVELQSLKDTKKERRMVESAFSEEKPAVSTTPRAKAVPMDNNYTGYKDVPGQRTEQPERLTFPKTPRMSLNQRTKMSNRSVDLATGAMGSLLHKLRELLNEDYNLEESTRVEVESFLEELMHMLLALRKVSEVERVNLDDQVKYWANSVRELSYDIEDVVDGFLVHMEDAADTGFFMGLIQRMFNLFKLGKTHNPVDDAIKCIKKQVQVVSNSREKWKIDEALTNLVVHNTTTIDPRVAAIYKDQKELVGMKEPIEELIKFISNKDCNEDVTNLQLNIVSIVGFGGLGKTTLAKEVYDKLQYQFNLRAFVSVGRNPNVKNVFEEILRKLGSEYNAHLSYIELIEKIRRLLANKRYLIVIDDIWDSSVWEDGIKCVFPEDNSGSSMVVTTTRIRYVADDCCRHNRGYVYEMKPLDDLNSRKLFISRLFGSKEASPNVPEDISTDILKKCGGMPLAIISIARLLAHNPRSRWGSVRNSLMSIFEGNHKEVKDMEQILDLSYRHLSHNLRTCLLDIGKYREDQEIGKDDLLRQWIAQDFANRDRDDPEDVAEEYFHALINMSMIQPAKIDYNDDVLSCQVHDIMLDLIRSKSVEENFGIIVDRPEVVAGEYKRVRRVSIHYDGEEDSGILAATNRSLSHVRSVLLFSCSLVPSFLLKCVRVFHLEDPRRKRLDLTGISGLFLLRYLKISFCEYVTLPGKIGELRQLETVEVEGIEEAAFLPSDIVTLPRLLHLSYPDGGMVLPDGIERLKSLRTLRGVAFMESSADNIKSLGDLTKLRELQIHSGYRRVVEEDELQVNTRIDALSFSIGKLSSSLRRLEIGVNCLMVLHDHGWSSTITPPRSLQKLDLSCYFFQTIPGWISQLHELYSLSLLVGELANGVSTVAGLPSLAYLQVLIRAMGREERVIVSGREFGALKHLDLDCPYLSLAFQEAALPRLEKLGMSFRYLMSVELIPVGIEYLPVGTLREIRLRVKGPGADKILRSQFEQNKADVGLLLKTAFEPHHPSAYTTIDFQEPVGSSLDNHLHLFRCWQEDKKKTGQ